jgi:hypothetical protein
MLGDGVRKRIFESFGNIQTTFQIAMKQRLVEVRVIPVVGETELAHGLSKGARACFVCSPRTEPWEC